MIGFKDCICLLLFIVCIYFTIKSKKYTGGVVEQNDYREQRIDNRRNNQPYTKVNFQNHYRNDAQWNDSLPEEIKLFNGVPYNQQNFFIHIKRQWEDTPFLPERRIGLDDKSYTWDEFLDAYKNRAEYYWNHVPFLPERRIDLKDHKSYTWKEFLDEYEDRAADYWYHAPPVAKSKWIDGQNYTWNEFLDASKDRVEDYWNHAPLSADVKSKWIEGQDYTWNEFVEFNMRKWQNQPTTKMLQGKNGKWYGTEEYMKFNTSPDYPPIMFWPEKVDLNKLSKYELEKIIDLSVYNINTLETEKIKYIKTLEAEGVKLGPDDPRLLRISSRIVSQQRKYKKYLEAYTQTLAPQTQALTTKLTAQELKDKMKETVSDIKTIQSKIIELRFNPQDDNHGLLLTSNERYDNATQRYIVYSTAFLRQSGKSPFVVEQNKEKLQQFIEFDPKRISSHLLRPPKDTQDSNRAATHWYNYLVRHQRPYLNSYFIYPQLIQTNKGFTVFPSIVNALSIKIGIMGGWRSIYKDEVFPPREFIKQVDGRTLYRELQLAVYATLNGKNYHLYVPIDLRRQHLHIREDTTGVDSMLKENWVPAEYNKDRDIEPNSVIGQILRSIMVWWLLNRFYKDSKHIRDYFKDIDEQIIQPKIKKFGNNLNPNGENEHDLNDLYSQIRNYLGPPPREYIKILVKGFSSTIADGYLISLIEKLNMNEIDNISWLKHVLSTRALNVANYNEASELITNPYQFHFQRKDITVDAIVKRHLSQMDKEHTQYIRAIKDIRKQEKKNIPSEPSHTSSATPVISQAVAAFLKDEYWTFQEEYAKVQQDLAYEIYWTPTQVLRQATDREVAATTAHQAATAQGETAKAAAAAREVAAAREAAAAAALEIPVFQKIVMATEPSDSDIKKYMTRITEILATPQEKREAWIASFLSEGDGAAAEPEEWVIMARESAIRARESAKKESDDAAAPPTIRKERVR